MEDLSRQLKKFTAERDWEQFHSPKNLAMALSVETAEILEHFQWLSQEESRSLAPEKVEEVREEIADVLIYLTELSATLGIDPLRAAHEKIEVNRRKYPAEVVRGKALKYTEYSQEDQTG